MIEFMITGRPVVKKNTKRIFGSGRRKVVVYTSIFRNWEAHAVSSFVTFWQNRPPITENVEAHFEFHFKNRQGEADLSNLVEAPQDALVKAGILEDDRQIYRLRATKHFGAAEPKTIIRIYQIKEDQ